MLRFWKKESLISGLVILLALCGVISVGYAETDVTAKVQLVQSRLMFDIATNTSYLDVSVKNTSQGALLTPIRVVIDSISPSGVTVANADGRTTAGKPYFEYSTGNGQLLAGQSAAGKRWSFANPARVRFSYTTQVVSDAGVETINGISVPPIPDATVNKATIKGVDSNSNGLRDDVERMLAQEFGSNAALYEEAKEYAITLQSVITNPTTETISEHLDSFRCIGDSQKLSDIDKATTATLDTPERRAAYGQTFAGAIITKEGCQ